MGFIGDYIGIVAALAKLLWALACFLLAESTGIVKFFYSIRLFHLKVVIAVKFIYKNLFFT